MKVQWGEDGVSPQGFGETIGGTDHFQGSMQHITVT